MRRLGRRLAAFAGVLAVVVTMVVAGPTLAHADDATVDLDIDNMKITGALQVHGDTTFWYLTVRATDFAPCRRIVIEIDRKFGRDAYHDPYPLVVCNKGENFIFASPVPNGASHSRTRSAYLLTCVTGTTGCTRRLRVMSS